MKKKIIISVAMIVLVAMMAVVLCSCVPSSTEKAKEKMEKAGYTVVVESGTALSTVSKFLGVTGLQSSVVASKGLEEGVTAYFFDTKENATAALNKFKEAAGEDEDDDDYEYGQSGKVVYGGTKEAVKAFKK